MAEPLLVGMAQWRIARAPAVLGARGLGSCVAVCLWDPRTALGAMAHCMLPGPSAGLGDPAHPAKFCDQAVAALARELEAGGARIRDCRAYLVGGARMFPGLGTSPLGERNVEAARSGLRALGLAALAEDCGGNAGRSLDLDCLEGTLRVWSAFGPARTL